MALRTRFYTYLHDRLFILFSLFLFIALGVGCEKGSSPETGDIVVKREDKKAVAVNIPFEQEPDLELLEIYLENHKDQTVLGEWKAGEGYVEFYPLVPFTQGSNYDIYLDNQLIGSFYVDKNKIDHPDVIAIYPQKDTVPENLLKMYVRFNTPMRQGEAVKNITVLDMDSKDTLEGTFLDLQPELWNEDNTLLTLWLDPGRIKRGLIPNETLGIPLHKGRRYRLILNKSWRGANGALLTSPFVKDIYTTHRDSLSPKPGDWELLQPSAGVKDPIIIKFNEPLDAILITEAIQILDSEGNLIPGKESAMDKETSYAFNPEQPWKPGNYIVQIESRLEDLAGNNLNRLFDEDISDNMEDDSDKEVYEIQFEVQ